MLANFVAVQFFLMRKPRTVVELCTLSGSSRSAVDRYVGLMLEEGMIVEHGREGRHVVYRWVDLTQLDPTA